MSVCRVTFLAIHPCRPLGTFSLGDGLHNGEDKYLQDHEKIVHITLWAEEQEGQVARIRAFVTAVGKMLLVALREQVDWAMTINKWLHGNLSLWSLLGLLPVLSSQIDETRNTSRLDKADMDETEGTLLRPIHSNDVLPDGTVLSRAFREPAMLVFCTGKGATPQEVLDALDYGTGGQVAALDLAQVLEVPDVEGLAQAIDPTLGKLGAYQVLNNGSRDVARQLRDLATIVLE
jgi:hypothetical protein